jgi:preprotein translocase subunit YajC
MIKLMAQVAAPAGAGAPGGGGLPMLGIEMALIFGGFYFLFIAPQRKKQKEHDKMLAGLQTGDEVITTGGIYGVITNVKDDRFVVRVSDTTKIEVGKTFIQAATKKPSEEKKAS